jgi:hypothetical protein
MFRALIALHGRKSERDRTPPSTSQSSTCTRELHSISSPRQLSRLPISSALLPSSRQRDFMQIFLLFPIFCPGDGADATCRSELNVFPLSPLHLDTIRRFNTMPSDTPMLPPFENNLNVCCAVHLDKHCRRRLLHVRIRLAMSCFPFTHNSALALVSHTAPEIKAKCVAI